MVSSEYIPRPKSENELPSHISKWAWHWSDFLTVQARKTWFRRAEARPEVSNWLVLISANFHASHPNFEPGTYVSWASRSAGKSHIQVSLWMNKPRKPMLIAYVPLFATIISAWAWNNFKEIRTPIKPWFTCEDTPNFPSIIKPRLGLFSVLRGESPLYNRCIRGAPKLNGNLEHVWIGSTA